jgi:hypothetical protein
MVVLANANGMPTDRYISTYHFSGSAAPVADMTLLHTSCMLPFLTEGPSGAVVNPWWTWLGPQVSRAAGACRVSYYDLGEAQPRTPHTFTFTVPGAGNAPAAQIPLPAEVALCLSLKSDHNGPRGMGRVYLGPWHSGAITNVTDFGEARPHPDLQTSMGLAAGALKTAALNAVLPWSVLSRADDTTYPIVKGWVDNAWDTQRSRGMKASGRVLWPIP